MSREAFTERVLVILLFGACLVAGWEVCRNLILQERPFSWDEWAHALRGLLIAWDVRQGDWVGLLFDTYRQVYWPPVHSWFTGGTFLLFGASEVTARLVSLILWILLVLTLFFAARRLSGRTSVPAGILCVMLALTSPPLSEFAARCMLEIPGLLAISLTLLAYFRTVDDDTPGANAGLAIALLATFFTKTNYGVLLLMAVALMRLIEARGQPRRLMSRSNFYLALPMVVVFAIWFAYPAKLVTTWQTLLHKPHGAVDWYTWEGLLFYPRALLQLSGSPWLCVVYAGAVGAAFRFWGNRKVRLLATVAAMQFLMGELHHTKDARHIFPIFPAVFLLVDHFCVAWWERARSARRRVIVWTPRLACAVILVHTLTLPGGVEAQGAARANDVIEYVCSLVQEPGSSLIVSVKGNQSVPAPLLEWTLIQQGLLDPPQAGSMTLPWEERKLQILSRRLPGWLAGRLTPVFTRAEQPGKLRTLIVGIPSQFDAAAFRRFFPSTVERGGFARVVVVNPLQADPISPLPDVPGVTLELVSSREFSAAKTRVDLLRSGAPQAD